MENNEITTKETIEEEIITAEPEQEEEFDTHIPAEMAFDTREEYEQFAMRQSDPDTMDSCSMKELYSTVIEERRWIVDGLLYPGVYIFAGAPKIGKSFLAAHMGFCVSKGYDVFGKKSNPGGFLYYALEDSPDALHARLVQMVGDDVSDNLTTCFSIQTLDQLKIQLLKFRDIMGTLKLVIIDTFQVLREPECRNLSYADDYDIIRRIKGIAMELDVCIILMHHTRKPDTKAVASKSQPKASMQDEILGTRGLTGAADGCFVLHNEGLSSGHYMFEVTGREIKSDKIPLLRDEKTMVYTVDSSYRAQLDNAPTDPIFNDIRQVVNEENTTWIGTPTRLAELLGGDYTPKGITCRLNAYNPILRQKFNIRYERGRSRDKRTIRLTYVPPEVFLTGIGAKV